MVHLYKVKTNIGMEYTLTDRILHRKNLRTTARLNLQKHCHVLLQKHRLICYNFAESKMFNRKFVKVFLLKIYFRNTWTREDADSSKSAHSHHRLVMVAIILYIGLLSSSWKVVAASFTRISTASSTISLDSFTS